MLDDAVAAVRENGSAWRDSSWRALAPELRPARAAATAARQVSLRAAIEELQASLLCG